MCFGMLISGGCNINIIAWKKKRKNVGVPKNVLWRRSFLSRKSRYSKEFNLLACRKLPDNGQFFPDDIKFSLNDEKSFPDLEIFRPGDVNFFPNDERFYSP